MPPAVSAEVFSDLVWKIYGCALDRAGWAATLDELRTLLGCEYAFLHLDDLQTRNSIISESAGLTPYWLALQPQMAPELTSMLMRLLDGGHSLDEPSVASRFMTDAEIQASSYSRNWGAPQGLVDYMDFFLIQTPTRLACLGFGRHGRNGRIQEREVELGRLLIPHLRQAVTISNLLHAQTIAANAIESAFNAVGTAVFIVDESAHVEFFNTSASQLMERCRLLSIRSGRIATYHDVSTSALHAAIARAGKMRIDPAQAISTIHLEDESPPTIAHVFPLGSPADGLLGKPKIAIFAQVPVENTACASALAQMYKLTPGETRLLEKLIACRTLIEAARELKLAEPTARTHLSRIFAKTGTTRQSELLRLATHVAARSLPLRTATARP